MCQLQNHSHVNMFGTLNFGSNLFLTAQDVNNFGVEMYKVVQSYIHQYFTSLTLLTAIAYISHAAFFKGFHLVVVVDYKFCVCIVI